jgi:hypothetical protein
MLSLSTSEARAAPTGFAGEDHDMKARPHTTKSKKRIIRRKEARRAGNRPALGIPPSCMKGGPRK